jgi:CBS domain-containing protein
MATTLDRLRSLRVADAMNHQVVPIMADQTMSDAAALFKERHISGAPVVDREGRCVGVLSAADFVSRDSDSGGVATSLTASEKTIIRRAPGGPWEIQDVFPDRVSAHMTPAVQSVAATISLVEAGRIMCSQHIHRLPVLDADGHPRGMLTALDIVAALVQAVDELQIS